MNNKIILPGSQVKGYDKAYELSYQLARSRTTTLPDLRQQCEKTGAEYEGDTPEGSIRLRYLGHFYRIVLPEGEVSSTINEEPATMRDKILILHYFITTTGSSPTNRLVTFRELPAGRNYFPTFIKRVINPITERFGSFPEELITAAENLDGSRNTYGDISVTIQAFPRMAVTLVLWRGDKDFPPQGNILFDANVSDYLPLEDITILCETIVWKLVRFPHKK